MNMHEGSHVLCETRLSAKEILEHSFLAVEPDVVLLAADATHVHLTLQVVFKGLDKLSVKFDFNVETDTAEQVVREMVSNTQRVGTKKDTHTASVD